MEEYKESPWGKIPIHWRISSVKEETDVVTDYVANGSFASLAENVKYKTEKDYAVLIRLVDYNNQFKGDFVYIDKNAYEFLGKSKLYGDEIIISNVGANVGTVFKCPHLEYRMSLAPNSIMVKFKGNNDFYYYWLKSHFGQHMLQSIVTGSAQPKFNKTNFKDLQIPVPPLDEQESIASILKSLDDKIEVNRRINDNLEQQAMALFDMMFPGVASGEDIIGNIIIPKRGKGLLSKDAVEGNVPVVAGGLEPATYHNESNTVAPVVTISASGANAGFVNLWQIPVWSSDSSFIDASMTENVYFWYVMLKKRQKEIFDAQTGSAQPHIYPKHIAEMPMGIFELSDVEKFTEIVTPMFEIRGRNLKESERLASLRDTLLPKLMSGELKLNEVNV